MWRSLVRASTFFRPRQQAAVAAARPLVTSCACCSQKAESGVPYETLESTDKSRPDSVPAQADVVVIGGGSIGCSTLYHLAHLGVTNAVLVERDQLTSGTTWHTGGLVWNLRPSDVEVQLLMYMAHLVRTVLEAETGVVPGWVENGGLFIANNKERLDEYKRLATLGKVYGIESFVLSPDETKKLFPLMNTSDIYGTLYSPSDGSIDPAGFCSALTRGATKLGAKVLTNCPVTGIQVGEDEYGVKRVKGVETVSGTIKTSNVVNACGVWSPYIGQMAGVSVPLTAMHHHYVVSERIEGIHGMPNVRDHDASVYLKVQGDGLAFGGYEPNPIFWKQVKNDFAFSLFELDWDVFGFNIDGCVNRIPALETTGIKSTVCGPESFTPDHKPLMGESPEVRGFYLNCAMNSSGLMLGGGTGKQMAHWIVDGRPELDMYGYDIRRFDPKVSRNLAWVDERSQEAYAKNYSTVFPHDEPLAGRLMRKDALHKVLEDAGCVYQERLGWERPGWFATDGPAPVLKYDYYGYYDHPKHENYRYKQLLGDDYTFDFPKHHNIIEKECMTCRESVAIFNMSYFGKMYVTGPDAQKAMDWIFTNNMSKPAGSVVYTCALNKAGGVECDLTVSMIESGTGSALDPAFDGRGFYVAAGGGVAQHVKTHMKTIMEDEQFDCSILDHSEDMGVLSIQGPKSRELLQSLTSADLSDKAFPFYTHQVIDIAGHKARALRLSFVGELGWEMHFSNEAAVAIHQAIMEAGAKFGIVNGGYRALDSLSLEKGYHLWRSDLRAEDTPHESGLGFLCKLKTDTQFLGRGAVEKQKAEGIRKKRACFTIEDHVPLLGFECIRRNGQVVGHIRRGEYGYYINQNLGYGYVSNPNGDAVTNEFLQEGDYTIERMGEIYPAQIHLKSPFDPQNKRLKGIYEGN
ncbi:sarcosine dehydrogenase, mitochondrial-like [Acanthaster planci]|uniref:Sarcosine dehydrogenase, mitochondrial-like n=1 Tax=Acanthaster planci TaxID=133434 RepID=A0A8B7Z5Z4_ACAPL|nr:sarcosine dehydrogenase, mitochondrial-like [Acanthaster planci]XP_022101050.1 sarcosine dehydrogenase, mitochondrial-like [Acanthaster planci]XP_022101052.1 sarcosine dehydrogenase, mitochondrial-like [Acanthaster planci]